MKRKQYKKIAPRDIWPILLLALALVVTVSLPLTLRSQTAPVEPTRLPGQSVTVLSDGRWLLTGGESLGGSLSTASIWNPRTAATTQLPGRLQSARAWHTATVLSNGTVFIFGGIGSTGKVINSAEIFDPIEQTFTPVSIDGSIARARHTATLLTDGTVLIAGGVGPNGKATDSAELWDYGDSTVTQLRSLTIPRQNHTARLLETGGVLLKGGTDSAGNALDSADLFDPNVRNFSFVDAAGLKSILPAATPALMATLPVNHSVDVPIDSLIALRFSKPLRVATVNNDTVTLSGPDGIERIKVVSAEGGMLAFVTPDVHLDPGATYFLTINGAVDLDGLLLPASGISFTTKPSSGANQPLGASTSSPDSTQGIVGGVQPSNQNATADEDSKWTGKIKDGKPHSDWQDLPSLQAGAGITALSGQVLDLHGEPLANVTLQINSEYGSAPNSTKTDETGRFLLTNLQAEWTEIIIDGTVAQRREGESPSSIGPAEDHGIFEYGLDIKQGETNVLPFTIWLPKIDKAHAVQISSPTISEIVVTTPRIQGLELHIPAGTTITDYEGKTVKEVSLTPIPVDRPPFPLPTNVEVPIYFTVQPGSASLNVTGDIGARIHYPNNTNKLPGTRFQFWHYDPDYRGWYVYGMGTVTPDGKRVIPDPGISIYEFTGAMAGGPGGAPPPPLPPPCKEGEECKKGDPVDIATGLFILNKTDLYLPDGIMPISFTRTYRPQDTRSRAFGIGSAHSYDLFVITDAPTYSYMEVILPDGGRIHYDRISPGTDFQTAVFEDTTSPTKFYKSRISFNNNWELKLKDSTVYTFREQSSPSRPTQNGLLSIKDRNGNVITITRDSLGNSTRITSPGGRWIDLTYDGSNRVIQIKDNIGRTVTYTYDATGRLATVTDPNGGVSEYAYDTSSRMLTLKDARGIVYLTNEYDATGKVTKQTLADGGIYLFNYTMNGSTVVQTDITDPRGNVTRATFNSTGQILTYTEALGKPEERTKTYSIQTGSDFTLSQTDPLNRTTSYTYDTMGNVTSVTRLSGTADAVTTSYTYDPTFNQITSVTDPLNHTTTFGYDTLSNVISVTNPLNQTTTIARNSSGQPISITDPLNNTTQLTYDLGDLATVTDPLSNTTTRITDSAGRVLNVTNPLGNPTIYDYDVLNRLTQAKDPLNGATQFGYDPNGNLLSVTDARNNSTVYTYENMDRLATRQDPLLRTESYQYDLAGNMTQFTDRKSQATTYTYDALNRRMGVTYADASTTSYTYDAGTRLTQVVDSIAGTITRTYDGLDRLSSETTPQGSVSYTYDATSRRTTMTVGGQPSVGYSYDNANRLTQITQGSAAATYTYDAAGRRTSLTLPNGVLVEYAYDSASRLISITYKQNGTTVLGDLTYEYDKNGNRTKTGGSFARTGIPAAISATAYDAANEQTAFGGKTLTYDNNGNLQTITDASGTTTYTWNARNQLVGISGPSVSASFVYDGLGRREAKTINGNLTQFLYDSLNPVQETWGATVLANILPGLRIDEFLTRTDVASGVTSYFLADALGSPVAVTDSNGNVQTEYTYEPFGQTTIAGASNSNPYQYTGRENDGTGLYYYRARYSRPELQRFVTEDPLECEQRKGVNLYGYVSNSPLNLADPSGLQGGGGTKESCTYYDERCKRNKTKSSDDSPDDYYCNASQCCRAFPEGPKENCTRECLIEADKVMCGELPEAVEGQRQGCRNGIHVICYLRCGYFPNFIPPASCRRAAGFPF